MSSASPFGLAFAPGLPAMEFKNFDCRLATVDRLSPNSDKIFEHAKRLEEGGLGALQLVTED